MGDTTKGGTSLLSGWVKERMSDIKELSDEVERQACLVIQWRDMATRMAHELREWSSATPLVSTTTTGDLLNEFDQMIEKDN